MSLSKHGKSVGNIQGQIKLACNFNQYRVTHNAQTLII